jgi:hypothetical protein
VQKPKRVNDDLQLEDVRLIWRNFAGEKRLYNEGGKRNFAIPMEQDLAEGLAANGWPIKSRERENDEGKTETLYHLPVTVNMEGKRPPNLWLISQAPDGTPRRTPLDAENLMVLDYAEFDEVDVILRPYNWGPIQGNYGVSAYLKTGFFILHQDDLERKYAHVPLEQGDSPLDTENIMDVEDEWIEDDKEPLSMPRGDS